MVIVQEAVHYISKSKKADGYCAIKLDLEKAYDKLEWSFIREALYHFDIPLSLSKVIMKCISTSRLAVLINGSPAEWIYL